MPNFNYSGFLLLSLCVDERKDLQNMQNDALRFCYNVKLMDKVSISKLHERD